MVHTGYRIIRRPGERIANHHLHILGAVGAAVLHAAHGDVVIRLLGEEVARSSKQVTGGHDGAPFIAGMIADTVSHASTILRQLAVGASAGDLPHGLLRRGRGQNDQNPGCAHEAASATDERSRCSPLRFARPTINQAATFAMRCYKNNFKRLHNY